MDILKTAKSMSIQHNVSLRVLDPSGEVVQSHTGHNAATHSMLLGIGHYLAGEGILNQGYDMLSMWVPRFISLGTMGLINQEQDEEGLPIGIGEYDRGTEEDKFVDYMTHAPGFGADGYDAHKNNFRESFGLGPKFSGTPVGCELISDSFPRAMISYRDVLPESQSEIPQTIDVVYSAMVSTGALSQFRDYDKDYVFITEAGLWATNHFTQGGDGLLAGFRIMPQDRQHWDMTIPYNREILRRNILKVKRNQVVQVIWKIQLGGLEDVSSIEQLYPDKYKTKWWSWDGKDLTPT